MRTSPGLPDESNRDIQSPTGPVLDPIEVLPGYTFPTDPPQGTLPPAVLGARLDGAENTAADIERQIVADVGQRLQAIQSIAAPIEAQLVGGPGRRLDQVESSAAKMIKKLRAEVNKQLGTAYNYGFSTGLIYPTIEQVIYGLDSGDYLGSVAGLGADGGAAELRDVEGAEELKPPPPVPGPVIDPPPQFPFGEPSNSGAPSCINLSALRYRPSWENGGTVETAPGVAGSLPLQPSAIPFGKCGYEYTVCAQVGNQQVPVVVVFPGNGELAVATDGGLAQVDAANAQYTPVRLWPGSVKGRKVCNLTQPNPNGGGPGGGGGGGNTEGSGGLNCPQGDPIGIAATELDAGPSEGGGSNGWDPWKAWTSAEAEASIEHQCWIVTSSCFVTNTVELGKGGAQEKAPGPTAWGPVQVITKRGYKPAISGDYKRISSFESPPPSWDKAIVTEIACPKYNVPPPPPPPEGGACPIPPKLDCIGDLGKLPKLTLDGDAFCTVLESALKDLKFTPEDMASILQIGTNATAGESPIMRGVLGLLMGSDKANIPNIWERFSKWLGNLVVEFQKQTDCNVPASGAIAVLGALIGLVQRWTGALPPQVTANQAYAQNAACPWLIPTGPEADNIYLADEVDGETWKCWQRANGFRIPYAEKTLETKRGRVSPDWLAKLKMRGKLTAAEFDQLIRKEGFIRKGDVRRLEQAQEAWPGIGDIIRFMVRDVVNEQVLKDFELDKGFVDNWKGDLEKLAEGAGVNRDLGKMFWRAHWEIPSYTQLSEMLHRLRPGRVPKEQEVTEEMVEKAITQNDMLPFWVRRMMAISYRTITRTDATRAFVKRAITDDEYVGMLEDVGYSNADAKKLFEAESKLRDIAESRSTGIPPLTSLARQYAAGELSEGDYRALLQEVGRPPEAIEKSVRSGKIIRSTNAKRAVIKQVRTSFYNGLLDEATAFNELMNGGIDIDGATDLMAQWRVVKRARGRMPGASQLCDWRWRSMIDATQHREALVRIGWSVQDANRIAASCEFDLSERAQKMAEAAAEKERKRKEREEKERKKQGLQLAQSQPVNPVNAESPGD